MARNNEPLKSYQQRVVERMMDPSLPGLVVAHGTGTGKSRTSIETIRRLGLPTNVIPPAALQANYRKELNRWMPDGGPPVNVQSQQRVALNGLENDRRNSLLVIDEAHRARTQGGNLMNALVDSEAKKKLLLTATPIFNHPQDLASLVNLVANKRLLPTDKAGFNDEYVNEKEVSPPFYQRWLGVQPGIDYELKNQSKLRNILNRYVDYQSGTTEGFPQVKDETIKVPMADHQMDVYKSIMGKAPLWTQWKVKSGLPPGRGEFDSMRAFLSGARQVSNTTQGFTTRANNVQSPKIDRAFKYFQQQARANPRYKAVVYSNYLNSGLNAYKQQLDQNRIPYGEFSGAVSPAVRNQMVADYNANKLRALLVSSAGSEGLDLKGTRLVQILEPHFNEEKEKQIIGRGARYQSHAMLPTDEQNVLVQRYMAQPQASFMDRIMGNSDVRGTDEYIRAMAQQKNRLNSQLLELMEQR